VFAIVRLFIPEPLAIVEREDDILASFPIHGLLIESDGLVKGWIGSYLKLTIGGLTAYVNIKWRN